MGSSRRAAPQSTFRTVAMVTNTVAAILFVLCAAAP
jgi:hypothetical protein